MSEQMNEYIGTWLKITRNEDQIGAVLRAHLWIENSLNEILQVRTHEDWSGKVYGGQFDFLDKVRIAASFGLIGDDLFQPLQRLGEIRNRLAHKIDSVLTEKQQEEFLSTIPKYCQDQAVKFLTKAELSAADDDFFEAQDVHRLEGMKGRPALSTSFLSGLLALQFELFSILDEMETG